MRDRGEAAALLQPQRRARVALLAEGGPAAPSGPGDDERVAGRAPLRPGTRSERPSAVTESDSSGALVVSPPTTGTPGSFSPS